MDIQAQLEVHGVAVVEMHMTHEGLTATVGVKLASGGLLSTAVSNAERDPAVEKALRALAAAVEALALQSMGVSAPNKSEKRAQPPLDISLGKLPRI